MQMRTKAVNSRITRLKSLDIFLSGVKDEEYQNMKHEMSPFDGFVPLLSQDFYAQSYERRLETFRLESEFTALKKWSEVNGWSAYLQSILEPGYDAMVLTDESQRILWVNKGFTKMTGYPCKDAVGQRPNFLQGPATSDLTRQSIRSGIKSGQPFTEVVVNYRKSAEPYKCSVTIHPLRNEREEVTHYLALEKEVA